MELVSLRIVHDGNAITERRIRDASNRWRPRRIVDHHDLCKRAVVNRRKPLKRGEASLRPETTSDYEGLR